MVVDEEAAAYHLEQDDCIDSDGRHTHSDIEEDIADDQADEPCKADQALLPASPDSREHDSKDSKKTHSWRRLLKPTVKRR